MFITRKTLKQMLFEERMKALDEAQKDQWHREQISDLHDEIRNVRREMLDHIDKINEMMKQKAIEEQKAAHEYDQA